MLETVITEINFQLHNLLTVAKAKCIITANKRVLTAESDTIKPLKSKVDDALEDPVVKSLIKHVFVAKRTEADIHLVGDYDVDLDEVSILGSC